MKKYNKTKIKKSIKFIGISLPILLLFLYLNKKYSFGIPCPIHKLFKIYCPGCGITRMFISLINLKFYKAFRYNPFVFTLLPFFFIYGIKYYYYWIQDKKYIINKKIWNTLLILSIIFMILRNIPYFSYLTPK